MEFVVGPQTFWGSARISQQGRIAGLQDRDPLGRHEVLAFVWPEDRTRSFHMGTVPYPIDILFVNRFGHIRKAVAHAQPDSREVWSAPAALVLESHGGQLTRHARIGDSVQIGLHRTAQISDGEAFMKAVVEGMVQSIASGQAALDWRPDRNGATESAVVNRPVVERWLRALNVAELQPAVATAMSTQGLHLVATLLIASGIAHSVRETPTGVVAFRSK